MSHSERRVPIDAMDDDQHDPAAADSAWMGLALEQARLGEGRVEPNPMVGAVVVRGGRRVGIGHHGRFGGPHAEVVALADAGDAAEGATLYVTLEPCCHHGKTPPCSEAILRSGIRRVVAATRDPFPKVDGGGLAALRAAGLEVAVGVEAEAATWLNAPYFKRLVVGRPFVTAKWAMTLDGKTAVQSGDSRWISSPESRSLVHELRGRMDGILVGIETALADDPQLTARPPGSRSPVRIVLDSSGRLPTDSILARTARETPVLIAVTGRAQADRCKALADLGCEILVVPDLDGAGRVDPGALLDILGSRGMTNLLVEGGGRVLGAFLDQGEVDAVEVYVAPILEGGDHAFTPIRGQGRESMDKALRLEGADVRQVGGDTRIRADVPQPWRSRIRKILGLPVPDPRPTHAPEEDIAAP